MPKTGFFRPANPRGLTIPRPIVIRKTAGLFPRVFYPCLTQPAAGIRGLAAGSRIRTNLTGKNRCE